MTRQLIKRHDVRKHSLNPRAEKAAVEDMPYRPLRVTTFPFEQESWPHPGEMDTGVLVELFGTLAALAPDELKDGHGGFVVPTPDQFLDMDDAHGVSSDKDLSTSLEHYLVSVPHDKTWAEPRMQELRETYHERSLTTRELIEVLVYALEEHQTEVS